MTQLATKSPTETENPIGLSTFQGGEFIFPAFSWTSEELEKIQIKTDSIYKRKEM